MFSLAGKVTLVTGAGSGIGAAIARTFANAGAFVYVADRDAAAGQGNVESIRQAGGEAEFIDLDVADEQAALKVGGLVLAAKGRLDVLVNNAGIGHVGAAASATGEDLDRLYRVNVKGVFHLVKAFLPGMLERQAGNIINLASIGGVVAVRDRFAYCMTKFAVVGMTKSIALDYAKAGIRCNCICPGRVETPFVSAWLKKYPDPQKAYEEACATQAVCRMGRPEEIAAAALYLASDESAFVTGSEFIIDGGWTAGK
jgi:2-keto-3-deoxy-L-fuconate dehydrogenase